MHHRMVVPVADMRSGPFRALPAGVVHAQPPVLALAADAQEVQAWFANQDVESSLLQLKQSDLDMIRVLDDLVQVLMDKGVLRITDLPPAAQSKLLSRTQARVALGGLNRLIDDDEVGVI